MVTRRWAIAGTAAVLVAGCAGGEPGYQVIDDLESMPDPVADEAAGVEIDPTGATQLAPVLAELGLRVDREVELPGSPDLAQVVVVDGEDAIARWTVLRALVPETGRYPVIVGGPFDGGGEVTSEFELTQEAWTFDTGSGYSATTALDAADAIDVTAWFDERVDRLGVVDGELDVDGGLPSYGGSQGTYVSTIDLLSGAPYEWVEIALLPTANGWEAPAHLQWGGWNDVPLPEELAAVFRHWADAYGAELVAMTADVVEFAVTAPPDDDAGAIDLAREHFLVAPDIVWQGTGDLAVLAAAVQGAPVWFFWWD